MAPAGTKTHAYISLMNTEIRTRATIISLHENNCIFIWHDVCHLNTRFIDIWINIGYRDLKTCCNKHQASTWSNIVTLILRIHVTEFETVHTMHPSEWYHRDCLSQVSRILPWIPMLFVSKVHLKVSITSLFRGTPYSVYERNYSHCLRLSHLYFCSASLKLYTHCCCTYFCFNSNIDMQYAYSRSTGRFQCH